MNEPKSRGTLFRRNSTGPRRSINDVLKPIVLPNYTGPILERIDPISYYEKVYEDEYDVSEAERAAISRLTILEIIDDICPANSSELTCINSLKNGKLGDYLVDHGLRLEKGGPADLHEIAKRDRLGFHLLKLALGHGRLDLRTWFLTQERRLFLFRLSEMKSMGKSSHAGIGILWRALESGAEDPLQFEEIPIKQFAANDPKILTICQQSMSAWNSKQIGSEFWGLKAEEQMGDVFWIDSLFKISAYSPEANFFIKYRLAFLTRGQCYLSRLHVPVLLGDRFAMLVNKSIDKMCELGNRGKLETALAHQQLGPFLKGLPNAMTINQEVKTLSTSTNEPASVSASLLPSLKSRLPFCARRMIDTLETQHHLKHFARLQLSLFLKGIKMPVEEQIKYWSHRWDDSQKFEREHVYTIRYQYGLEGKRQSRDMYACRTMLSNAFPVAGQTDAHGCPFRELKEGGLRAMLNAYGVQKEKDVEDICGFARNHEYQRACQTSFIALHPGHDGSGVGNHPIQYYKESCNYCAHKEKRS